MRGSDEVPPASHASIRPAPIAGAGRSHAGPFGMLRSGPAWIGGALAGIAGGFFGVGGGVVIVPILTGTFKLTQHQAHGTSLAIVGAAAVASLAVYALNGNVAWVTAAIVGVASMVTARWGARLSARLSSERLAQTFAVFLVLVALRLLWKVPPANEHAIVTNVAGIATDLGIGAAVGLLAGFMGVGGGVLAVPAFTLLLGMSQQMAQGTSLAVILLTAPAGALEHHRHGNVATRLIAPFALGAALGGPLASVLAQRLPQAVLVRGFAVFVLFNAVNLWIRADRKRRLAAV